MADSLEHWLRIGQCVLLAPAALFFATNAIHGRARGSLRRFGYPLYMAKYVAATQGTIILLNTVRNGKYAMVAQYELMVVMGGAVHAHVKGERRTLAAAPAVAVLCSAVACLILRGASPPFTIAIAALLAFAGWSVANAVQVKK